MYVLLLQRDNSEAKRVLCSSIDARIIVAVPATSLPKGFTKLELRACQLGLGSPHRICLRNTGRPSIMHPQTAFKLGEGRPASPEGDPDRSAEKPVPLGQGSNEHASL